MRFERLLSKIKRYARLVDQYMLGQINGCTYGLSEASSHLIRAGGKRLRPFLVLTSYRIFRKDVERVLPLAAAVEIFHTFTLIHDDIMDQDTFRRGVPTVHVLFGVPMAILAGDFLHAKAYELVAKADVPSDVKSRLLAELAETAAVICEGQAMDMAFEQRDYVSVLEYLEMIRKKTAWLFRLSCRMGALAAGAPEHHVRALTEYGEKLGLAFQLVDDWLGIFGDEKKTGKPVGSDVREGKKTYPIIYALESASDYERDFILDVLMDRPRSERVIRDAIEVIRRTGADEATKELARRFAHEAIEALSPIPDCEEKRDLIDLARFVVERSF